MRRPKGVKTKKSVAKRFKVTANGKIKRARAGRRHLLQGKSSKRRRKLRTPALVADSELPRIRACLPFTH